MIQFAPFGEAVTAQFKRMSMSTNLFVTAVSKDFMWAAYSEAIPAEHNSVFRTNKHHECSCCRNFVKNIGNVVAVVDGKIQTVWDIVPDGVDPTYQEIASAMGRLVRSASIDRLFLTKEKSYGSERNRASLADGTVVVFDHFHAEIRSNHHDRDPSVKIGVHRAAVQVFERGLKEISKGVVTEIIDAASSNQIYRGEEHLQQLRAFLAHLKMYGAAENKEAYIFTHAFTAGARIRNSVIGQLLLDYQESGDLERSVKEFEDRVAPANYKRTTALVTPGMVKSALAKIDELGLESALHRRYATIKDISVNDVLWVASDTKADLKTPLSDILMKAATKKKKHNLSLEGEAIRADDFLREITPKA